MAGLISVTQHHSRSDAKRVYYLSMEFLLGRSLDNAMLALGVKGVYGGRCTATARRDTG